MDLEVGEADQILQSLRAVGTNKIIGYLPNFTITDILGLNFEKIQADAESNGLTSMQLGPDECCIKSGAVYVYDSSALRILLEFSPAILRANEWPVNPDEFVRANAFTWVQPDDPIMPIIERAFTNRACQTDRD
jgi:hypothetical protein